MNAGGQTKLRPQTYDAAPSEIFKEQTRSHSEYLERVQLKLRYPNKVDDSFDLRIPNQMTVRRSAMSFRSNSSVQDHLRKMVLLGLRLEQCTRTSSWRAMQAKQTIIKSVRIQELSIQAVDWDTMHIIDRIVVKPKSYLPNLWPLTGFDHICKSTLV